jgi:hypothetical protein
MPTPPTAPAPELVEDDLEIPGLVLLADGGELPPPPGSATIASPDDEPEDDPIPPVGEVILPTGTPDIIPEEWLDEDEPEETQELIEEEPRAVEEVRQVQQERILNTPYKPQERTPSVVGSPEYKRLINKINELEKRQRSAEKNVLILAALCGLLFWQFQKLQKSLDWDGPVDAVPAVSDFIE